MIEAMNMQYRERACHPDYRTPFSSKKEVWERLLPYQVFRTADDIAKPEDSTADSAASRDEQLYKRAAAMRQRVVQKLHANLDPLIISSSEMSMMRKQVISEERTIAEKISTSISQDCDRALSLSLSLSLSRSLSVVESPNYSRVLYSIRAKACCRGCNGCCPTCSATTTNNSNDVASAAGICHTNQLANRRSFERGDSDAARIAGSQSGIVPASSGGCSRVGCAWIRWYRDIAESTRYREYCRGRGYGDDTTRHKRGGCNEHRINTESGAEPRQHHCASVSAFALFDCVHTPSPRRII